MSAAGGAWGGMRGGMQRPTASLDGGWHCNGAAAAGCRGRAGLALAALLARMLPAAVLHCAAPDARFRCPAAGACV